MSTDISIVQSSFAAGEVTEAIQSREDLAKQHVAAKTIRNAIVTSIGSAKNRGGFKKVAEVNDSSLVISGEFNMKKEFMLSNKECVTIKNCIFYEYPPDTMWVEGNELIQGPKTIFANVDTIYVLNYDKTVIFPWGN